LNEQKNGGFNWRQVTTKWETRGKEDQQGWGVMEAAYNQNEVNKEEINGRN
jgi:hypothetical protein